ncbi:MAG: transcription termination factor Rho [Planctomycetaceae bacterium]|nr:transcription termination factor Rho [Planctomycetaceae bacterium]
MPTSSSDSEGTSQRSPRRRSTPRSATSRPATTRSRRKIADDDVEKSVSDDDFGTGVVEEKAPREPRTPRRSRATADEKSTPETSSTPAETPPERRPRREPRSKPTPDASPAPEVGSLLDRSSRIERTSNRLERQIADVESQTGMRYFSTDELDFGDDDDHETPRSRGRSRFTPDDTNREDSRSEEHRNTRDDRDDSDRAPGWDEDSVRGDAGETASQREPGADGLGEDRRPRRRRRRRRRGPDGPVPSEVGGENRSSEPRNPDNRGADNRGGPGRYDSRNDGRDRARPQSGNRQDGGRGRRPSGSGNRGRRNDGGQPRGGAPGRGGRGQDRGMPRRSSRQVQSTGEVIEGTFEGVLELHSRGYGFLREPKKNYIAEDSNPFVSSSLVEKYNLREGVLIRGEVGMGTRNQGPRLSEVELIDGFTPEQYADVKVFDTLTAINPFEQIRLEVGPKPLTMRVMDLLCPIGKGQRALLVAPPRTGKTMLLQDIANSVSQNHPEIYLMVLLIDERPEEVTEMRRMVKGEVISSSLDSDVESHVRISQLIIERAKRLAEEGKDVFILLDSITRMARAFNKWSNTGRTATGGLDIRALDIPKKLFGQARRFDEGGSLTVCGTALIDTGSRMDEAIFQEFKGTGNMEMVLSRDLADRRIWPSIDISKSGTRREEKILDPNLLEGITMLRRSLVSMSPVEAMEQLTKTMEKFPTNTEFLTRIRAVL